MLAYKENKYIITNSDIFSVGDKIGIQKSSLEYFYGLKKRNNHELVIKHNVIFVHNIWSLEDSKKLETLFYNYLKMAGIKNEIIKYILFSIFNKENFYCQTKSTDPSDISYNIDISSIQFGGNIVVKFFVVSSIVEGTLFNIVYSKIFSQTILHIEIEAETAEIIKTIVPK